MIETAEARGEARGVEKGKVEEKVAIAKKLISQNIDIKAISIATGLSVVDINKLKNQMFALQETSVERSNIIS